MKSGILFRSLFPVILLLVPVNLIGQGREARPDEEKAEQLGDTLPKNDDTENKKTTSIAVEYVKKNLKEYLHPTSIAFLEDGRAKLTFEFGKKDADHEKIFTPNVDPKIQSDFRWTVSGEFPSGLRIGNRGMALLDCWFLDNLEVEIEYQQGASHNRRQIMAVMFYNDKKREGVGNNFGTQCITLRRGKIVGRSGKPEVLLTRQEYKFKLEVKDGVVKVYRNGRVMQARKYREKNMDSGRVGFLWQGGVAGIISKLDITGEVDAEKMLRVMQEGDPS